MPLHPLFEGRMLKRIWCFNGKDKRTRKVTAGLHSLECKRDLLILFSRMFLWHHISQFVQVWIFLAA